MNRNFRGGIVDVREDGQKKRTWYLWVLGILAPPIAAIWMWVGKRGTKPVRWLVTVWAIIAVIFGIASHSGGAGNTGNQTASTSTNTTSNKTVQPPTQPKQADWKTQAVTVDSVKAALNAAPRMVKTAQTSQITEIQVNDNDGTKVKGDKIVWIKVKPDPYWNETDFAQIMAQTMTAWSQKLFENPSISLVRVWGMADFEDNYGQSSEQPAVKMEWSRHTANQIQWANFRDLVETDYKKAFLISDYYYIHPGMWKNLKDSDKQQLPVEGGTSLS